MTHSNTKEAIKKRSQRAKKLDGLSELEIQCIRKIESQKRAERRLKAKLNEAPQKVKQNIEKSIEFQKGSFKHRKALTTLSIKPNKKGLKDKVLKKTFDDYQERLKSGGQTHVEALVEQYEREDEKEVDRWINLKRKLRSSLQSRRRLQGLYAQTMLNLAVANRAKRQMKRDKEHAESEHERILGGYEELRLKYNILVDKHDWLQEMKPTQSHLELHNENKKQ